MRRRRCGRCWIVNARDCWPPLLRGDRGSATSRSWPRPRRGAGLFVQAAADGERARDRAAGAKATGSTRGQGCQAKASVVGLMGWRQPRRIIVLRRRMKGDVAVSSVKEAVNCDSRSPIWPEREIWEYQVLVTSLSRDRRASASSIAIAAMTISTRHGDSQDFVVGEGCVAYGLAGFVAKAAGWLGSLSRPRQCRDRPGPAWRAWSRRQRCGMTGGPSGSRCRGSAAASRFLRRVRESSTRSAGARWLDGRRRYLTLSAPDLMSR